MDKQYKTVVQGEASESDDEEETINEKQHAQSVVVEGEASESDEEEIDTSANRPARKELPPLNVTDHSASFESIDEITGVPTLSQKQIGRPKYDTVLNKKLWESNLSLCNNLNGLVSQAYLSAAKEISNCGYQLAKSHANIQDVSHHMRLLTNDLFNLHDTIDIITTCTILPNIQLPKKRSPSDAPSQPSDTADSVTATSPQTPIQSEAPQPTGDS